MIKLTDGKKATIQSDNVIVQKQDDGLYTVIINDVKLTDSNGSQLSSTVSIPNCKLNDFWNNGSVDFSQQYPDGCGSIMWTIEIPDNS